MARSSRDPTTTWPKSILAGLTALLMTVGCESDDPVQPDPNESRSQSTCVLAPRALDFGAVPLGSTAEQSLDVRILGTDGPFAIAPSRDCPYVSVAPQSEARWFDGGAKFSVTYAPHALGVLACDLALEITLFDAPGIDGNPKCPAVPLSGRAFTAASGLTR